MKTTGPWRYLRSGYGSRNADFDIVTASGGRVASTPYEDKAKIIAAAPELREALIDLNALIAAWRVTGTPELALIAAAQERADAAIAKADGKAPDFREPAREGCASCGAIRHVDRSCDCGGAP